MPCATITRMMMPALYTSLGPWTVHTFTLWMGVAILLTGALALRAFPAPERAARADALLATLVGAVLGARLLHVLLNLDYFASAGDEALRVAAGGLEWHGALAGGLLGLWLLVRLRFRSDPTAAGRWLSRLLDALVWALPLLLLGGWYGCLGAGCGTGYEVDTLARYPAWAAVEYADVYGIVAPRWFTPGFGMVLGMATLVWVWLLRRTPGRFALTTALVGTGMFVIGIFRADRTPLWFGLRADQVLDVLTVALSLAWAGWSVRNRRETGKEQANDF